MRRYRQVLGTYVPAIGLIAVLTQTPRVSSLAIGNLATQAVLFMAIAAVPAYRTGRMSYVDIAWP